VGDQNLNKISRQQDCQLPELHIISRFRKEILCWYDDNGRKFPWRKSSTSKYQYIIAEILLQRTRAETVAAFFPDFIREVPSWKSLSSASIDQLQDYLRPIGLWRRRALSIQALASEMTKRKGRFPRNREAIEALPGIGQYVANAVLLFCHGDPHPLLDVNMARVLERVFGPRKMADIRYDPSLQQLALKIVQCKTPVKINWAILDLAAGVCLQRKPRCSDCPLATICRWNN